MATLVVFTWGQVEREAAVVAHWPSARGTEPLVAVAMSPFERVGVTSTRVAALASVRQAALHLLPVQYACALQMPEHVVLVEVCASALVQLHWVTRENLCTEQGRPQVDAVVL